MHALILAAVIAAGGTGTSHSPGASRHYDGMSSFFASPAQNKPQTALVAPRPGRLEALHVEKTDAGVGLGNFTVSVTVDGVTACSVTTACASTGLASETACAATFEEGDVLRLVITNKDVACAVLPKFTAYSTWLW